MISECGFSHIFTSKGRGEGFILNCAALLIFAFARELVKDVLDYRAVMKPPYLIACSLRFAPASISTLLAFFSSLRRK